MGLMNSYNFPVEEKIRSPTLASQAPRAHKLSSVAHPSARRQGCIEGWNCELNISMHIPDLMETQYLLMIIKQSREPKS